MVAHLKTIFGYPLAGCRALSVSIDGTKIQANASKHAAVSYARAGEMFAQLELEVQELMTRAEQVEQQETKDPLDIPAELTRARTARPPSNKPVRVHRRHISFFARLRGWPFNKLNVLD